MLVVALVLYGFNYFFSTRTKNKPQPAQAETKEEIRKALISTGTAYYAQLSEPQRLVFEERVLNFIGQKQFIARGEGMVITTEIKVQIAACAVQLTFGLPELHFTHFRTILIYPDRYYSTIYKRYHCGEVNTNGIIVLSWRDFETGTRNAQDGLNLGLHEMAHALHQENSLHPGAYDFLNQEYLTCWQCLSEAEQSRMQAEKSVFRRLCAAPDTHEFFAVTVELFFEMPLLLEKEHPEIYQALSNLLNQDPARQAG
ncbi:hypothetical protein OB13_03850 [Pontibacter sp. HJ8]